MSKVIQVLSTGLNDNTKEQTNKEKKEIHTLSQCLAQVMIAINMPFTGFGTRWKN